MATTATWVYRKRHLTGGRHSPNLDSSLQGKPTPMNTTNPLASTFISRASCDSVTFQKQRIAKLDIPGQAQALPPRIYLSRPGGHRPHAFVTFRRCLQRLARFGTGSFPVLLCRLPIAHLTVPL